MSVRARASRLPPDAWAIGAIVAAVLIAHLPYLLDFFDGNPLGPRGGLLSSVAAGVLGGQPTIDPNNGFISQAVSHLATRDLLHLQLPWWNPFAGTGMPLAGQMQSAAFFPPTWLTLLSNGQLYEQILLELVAGIATYLLLRRLSLNRWACAAAGIAFALSGTFAWFSHAPINPVAFLPLLLLGIELAHDAALARRAGGWWLIAIAGALSFYAGFPEVTYIDTLLAICWFAWRAISLPRPRLGAFAGKCTLGVLCAVLISSPLLIAMSDHFVRADLGLHTSSSLGSAHFHPDALPQLLMPYIYGPIFGYDDPHGVLLGLWSTVGGYLTASLLLLALVGLFSRGRRGLRLMLLGWTVLVFARMYGIPHFLFGVLGVLPNMSRVAFFRYATTSLELPVIILAALGIDELARRPEIRRRVAWAGLVMLVAVAAAALEARTITHQLPAKFAHRPYFAGSIGLAVVTIIAIAAASYVLRPRLRVPAVAAIVALEAVALFALPEFSAPRAVQLDLAPVAYLRQHLGTARFFTLGPLAPNYGSYFGLRSLNVNDFPPKIFASYVHRRLDQVVDPTVFVGNYGGGRSFFAPSPQQELIRNIAGYRAAGVAYVLSPLAQPLPSAGGTFTQVFQTPTTRIYRLSGSQPLFTASGCRVSFPDVATAEVSCPASSQLVRRESSLPGWSATIDGHSAQIRTSEGLFQSVAVPAGTHRVEFSYAPPYIGWGYLGFFVGLALLIGSAVWNRRRSTLGHLEHERMDHPLEQGR